MELLKSKVISIPKEKLETVYGYDIEVILLITAYNQQRGLEITDNQRNFVDKYRWLSQDCSISSVLTMEIIQSCANPSI